MNRNDLRRVDLNLLIVFETLMHERSVTRAAEKLFLGQPAISAALSRLRTLFDDPLFVRTGRSMEPTARAQEIFAHLSPALDSISTAMSRASSSIRRPAPRCSASAFPTTSSSACCRPCSAACARRRRGSSSSCAAPTIY